MKILVIIDFNGNPNILNFAQFWPSDKTRGLEQGTPVSVTARSRALRKFESTSGGPVTEVKIQLRMRISDLKTGYLRLVY